MGKDDFRLIAIDGLCDVCNASIIGAYKVPRRVFYESRRYHEWLRDLIRNSSRPAGLSATYLDVRVKQLITEMKSRDKTSHSAVCRDCIHMFLDSTS